MSRPGTGRTWAAHRRSVLEMSSTPGLPVPEAHKGMQALLLDKSRVAHALVAVVGDCQLDFGSWTPVR